MQLENVCTPIRPNNVPEELRYSGSHANKYSIFRYIEKIDIANGLLPFVYEISGNSVI
jgi:hypothetical protein